MPTGCHGGRSLDVEWQLRLEKPLVSCHKEPLLLGNKVWAAACGQHGDSEGRGDIDRGHGLKGLHWYDFPDCEVATRMETQKEQVCQMRSRIQFECVESLMPG